MRNRSPAGFAAPVYFAPRLKDILERPGDYRLPCLTPNPITSGKPQAIGTHMRWHEFELTFFDFPGQTLYHDGLLVEKDGGEALFFLGDSFTPSGIDDYCLQNRDFARAGEGNLYCLKVLDSLPPRVWLVNQHVAPTFRFSAAQRERMRAELMKRMAILKEMSPWPDPNYAIDESWAAVHPYGSTVRPGERVTLASPDIQPCSASRDIPPGLEYSHGLAIDRGRQGSSDSGSQGSGQGEQFSRPADLVCTS